jgi:hypothetical protein
MVSSTSVDGDAHRAHPLGDDDRQAATAPALRELAGEQRLIGGDGGDDAPADGIGDLGGVTGRHGLSRPGDHRHVLLLQERPDGQVPRGHHHLGELGLRGPAR